MTLKSRSDGVVSKDAESQPSTKLPVLLDLFYLSCLLTLLFAYWWHSEVSARLDRAIEDNELNITGRADQGCLIFNRVPKVGSQTINNLIGIFPLTPLTNGSV